MARVRPTVHHGGSGLAACISPLHTHDTTGILHTESASAVPNTLGEFFTEWGVTLSANCVETRCGAVAVYIDGKPYTGDPRAIQLLDHREIVVAVGTPPAHIPAVGDFSNA